MRNQESLLGKLTRWGNSKTVYMLNCSLATPTFILLLAIAAKHFANDISFTKRKTSEEIFLIEPLSADLGVVPTGSNQRVEFR